MPPPSILQCCLLAALLFFARPAWADVVTEVHTLIAKGDLAGALRSADAAVTAHPRDAQSRFLHALVLMDLQRDSESLAAFMQLSQEYPELPEPFNNIALLHARAGRLELARQALESALRNDPGHRAARINLGEVHLMLAVQAWEQASAGGPLDPRMVKRLDAARALVSVDAAASR